MWTEHCEDADKLNKLALSLIERVMQKHTASILDELHEQIAKARRDALNEVKAELEAMFDKVQKPTPLEKGMRMAIGSALDRVSALLTPNA